MFAPLHGSQTPMVHVNNFYVCGISFKSASIEVRSRYALNSSGLDEVFTWLLDKEIPGMVVSTCNRCEVYFFSEKPDLVRQKFAASTDGSYEEMVALGYLKKGKNALRHLMRVSVGLESQIPGDFEIIGQIKRSFKESQMRGTTNGLLERMLNGAIFASRRVKNETLFSTGSSSVSYACVRYLRNNVRDLKDKQILLYGLGKIGQMTLSNLLKHVDKSNISVMNKSPEKVEALIAKHDIKGVKIADKHEALKQNDIIIIATGADTPVLYAEDLPTNSPYWILDLSVPSNVDESVQHMPHVRVVNIDMLAESINETLKTRTNDIPNVEGIVRHELNEFFDWYHRKEMAKMAQYMQDALKNIASDSLASHGVSDVDSRIADEIAQRHKTVMFQHLRQFFGGISEPTTDKAPAKIAK